MQSKLVEQVRDRLSQQADKSTTAIISWVELEELIAQIDRLTHEREQLLESVTNMVDTDIVVQDVGC